MPAFLAIRCRDELDTAAGILKKLVTLAYAVALSDAIA